MYLFYECTVQNKGLGNGNIKSTVLRNKRVMVSSTFVSFYKDFYNFERVRKDQIYIYELKKGGYLIFMCTNETKVTIKNLFIK